MSRILLVDDDADGVGLRRLVLEHHGHSIVTALNPADALREMAAGPVECVVTDLRLPELSDGLRLIHELRELDATVRIVVLSGIALDAEQRSLVDEVLVKPARSEVLLRAIQGRT